MQGQVQPPAGQQSTNHLLMVRPAVFFANPQTLASNPYQHTSTEKPAALLKAAQEEQAQLIATLRAHGVRVTTLEGSPHCPDHIFPDWASTHALFAKTTAKNHKNGFILYAMHAPNRQQEKTNPVLNFFKKNYTLLRDFTPYEAQNLALESTASLCLDRVNKMAYAALSSRTSLQLATLWAEEMGYALTPFSTCGHTGQPIYHTDLVLWVGTKVAAICLEVIPNEKERRTLLSTLEEHHEVMLFSAQQLQFFCGNMLEVSLGGEAGEKLGVVMSSAAYGALTQAQRKWLRQRYAKLIHSPIPTIEKFGGGSVRCLVLELF